MTLEPLFILKVPWVKELSLSFCFSSIINSKKYPALGRNYRMSKYNILLADDQEENLSSTKDLLHRWGYQVDPVSSGDEAIECIRNNTKEYAVALLDYKMPGKTGAETATEIRALN